MDNLIDAIVNNDLNAIEQLLRNGADINKKYEYDYTPLHVAVQENNIDIVKYLLENGAGLENRDIYGNTPLIRAVSSFRGNGDIIEYLLANGADKDTKNNSGISALEWAENVANYDIVKYFRAE